MKFYTADPHYFHEKIIFYEKRPFKNVEEMNEVLIENWNKIITDKDECYILGDVGFSKDISQIISILQKLKGNKILVKGNHDKLNKYFRKEFKRIDNYMRINDNGKNIILSHYPFAIWDLQHYNSLSYFGHVHTKPGHIPDWKPMPNSYNVGVDVNNFTPITTSQVVSNLKKENKLKKYF